MIEWVTVVLTAIFASSTLWLGLSKKKSDKAAEEMQKSIVLYSAMNKWSSATHKEIVRLDAATKDEKDKVKKAIFMCWKVWNAQIGNIHHISFADKNFEGSMYFKDIDKNIMLDTLLTETHVLLEDLVYDHTHIRLEDVSEISLTFFELLSMINRLSRDEFSERHMSSVTYYAEIRDKQNKGDG